MCAQWGNKNQPERMLHRPIPQLSWQFVPQDIYQHSRQCYLETVIHYSDFFEVDTLNTTLAPQLSCAQKKIFTQYGSPMVNLTENGLQLIATDFAKELELQTHNQPSQSQPWERQCRSYCESCENILRKCQDPQPALLHIHNTITKGHQTSPVQWLMSRRTRTTVPTSTLLLKPEIMDPLVVREEMTAQLERVQIQL